MKKLCVVLMLVVLLVASTCFGASTCTTAVDNGRFKYTKCVVDWTSNSSGAATVAIVTTSGAKYVQSQTAPGVSGNLTTGLPTALYDLTITDGYTYDVAAGGLANRSGTAAELVIISAQPVIYGTLTLNVTNAGDTKSGRVVVTLQE